MRGYKSVNHMAVSDMNINIMIVRGYRKRYRNIIKAFYRQRKAEQGGV